MPPLLPCSKAQMLFSDFQYIVYGVHVPLLSLCVSE